MNLMGKFSRLLRALSPNCRDVSRLQSQALDGALPAADRLGLRLHLLLCRWCRRYGQQIRFLRAAAQNQADHDSALPEYLLNPQSRERIKARLRTAQNENPQEK